MPRIGLAYRLNDKTVIQAGYGLFYARMAGATLQDLFTAGNGVTVQSTSLNISNNTQKAAGPVYPNILSAAPAGLTSSTSLQFTAPNFATPYSQQASLAVERDLTHGLGLTISYLWSNGIHLYSVTDLNMPTTTTPVTYIIDNTRRNGGGDVYNPSGHRSRRSFGRAAQPGLWRDLRRRQRRLE